MEGYPPTAWVETFLSFTGDESADEWGLAAAIFVARSRKRTGSGPTFAELFGELIPDGGGFPSRLPDMSFLERRQVVGAFRLHVAIEWRRREWINWDHGVERSLRTGRTFRTRSRAHQDELRREQLTGSRRAESAL